MIDDLESRLRVINRPRAMAPSSQLYLKCRTPRGMRGAGSPRVDSAQFRTGPRTCRAFCGRLYCESGAMRLPNGWREAVTDRAGCCLPDDIPGGTGGTD